MSLYDNDKPEDELEIMTQTEKFSNLFFKLEDCNDDEQKHKIEKMIELIGIVNEEEFESVFTKELYDEIYKIIEDKKVSLKDSVLIVKHIGYWKALRFVCVDGFEKYPLSKKFEKMIIEENKKKKEKNKKLLIDLCECYLLLNNRFSSEFLLICVPCILKVGLKKEESEETKKEVEVALLALSNIEQSDKLDQKLYLTEITEIIEYNQEHQNLTRLAYQSAWQFLGKRFFKEKILEDVITNELHFAREARREIGDLSKSMDWKRKEEENKKRRRETKEELVLMRWLEALNFVLFKCKLWNEEFVGLINSIVLVFRATNENCGEISRKCIYLFKIASESGCVKVEDLLRGGAVDAILEEIQRTTIDNEKAFECFTFFMNISRRLKGKEEEKTEEAKRMELKREVFEKMEEEGHEDVIIKFCHSKFKRKHHSIFMDQNFNEFAAFC